MPYGRPVHAVTFVGHRTLAEHLLAEQVQTRPGTLLDEARLAEDVRRLYALEALEDVRIEATERFGKVLVEIVVRERPLVGSVVVPGASAEEIRSLGLSPGDPYEPARIQRRTSKLEEELVSAGHLDAEVRVRAKRRGDVVDLCVQVEEGARFVVAELALEGNDRIGDAELLATMETSEGRYNTLGKPFRADLFERDILYMTALYFDRGMVEAKVSPPRIERRAPGELVVRVPIEEGAVFHLGRVDLDGPYPGDPKAYREVTSTLGTGRVFSRSEISDVVAKLQAIVTERGQGGYVVSPYPEVDPGAHVIHVVLRAEPAP